MGEIKPLTTAVALTFYGTAALAQPQGLEEIIVTAAKRCASLQDVPDADGALSRTGAAHNRPRRGIAA